MPKRVRRGYSRKLRLEDLNVFQSPRSALVAMFGSVEAAALEWESVRDAWPHRPGSRPEGWWGFEPGVPAELRESPPLPVVVPDPHADQRRDLARRRRQWLEHMFPEEFAATESENQ